MHLHRQSQTKTFLSNIHEHEREQRFKENRS